ncbi:hypothetical protein PAHAL_5G154600 [Panicum hallii]|uniref:Uncharacterized protein n=1 Tax=Panicum hallii TaxID=206008 RepID=A0A2S3HRQ0_9POAL|nr:uncharacterized protein At4g18490 isoform X7 [Panicum hallii]PAN28504.2 hypothetical protein PAHAL_5G154600 [Panicum hallii]
MDESRKRDVPTASAENISSPLDEDFGNDFLSSWKLPKSGKDTIDFTVDSVPKSSKRFSFGNLDDFGLDGAFDKLPSFKMGMSDLDFSSPLKKKVKHSSSNGDDLSDGKKESEKNNFSFSFDFNELGKFCLDAKLGIEEKSMSKFTGKVDPVSSEGNKDAQRGLSAKASGILEDNNSKDKPQTQGVCTLRPSHPTNRESVKNARLPASNINAADSSDKIQEHTSVSPAIMKQTKVDSVPNGNHREHPKEIYPTKAAVNIPSQNFSGSAPSGEDPTQVLADPMSTKGATIADIGKVHISRESNDKEQSIGSQSKDTSTINPNVSGRLVGQFDSRNEVVEESVSLNEGSQGNRSFSDVHKKLLKKTSCGTKDTDEGTSGHKSLSSSMQRGITNVESALANERGSFSILSKSTNMKASRVELTSETALNQLSGASKVIKKMTLHPTDLKREHKQANAGPDKCKNALSKTYSKQASHGLLTTSINSKGDRNAKSGIAKLGIRSPMSDRVPEKESVQLTGTKGSPLTTSQTLNSVPEGKPALRSPAIMQKVPEESFLDPKAPTVLKHIMRSPAVRKSPQTVPELGNEMILGSGTPKAHVDIAISSRMPSEMGDISDLELPMLLENDGNLEKAEACRKELEDICILLKRKHAEAKELAVRAIVNNNTMLMLNHPMFEEKICSIKKFANGLRSKKYLFEEVGSINANLLCATSTATSKAIISLIGSAVYSWRPKACYLSVHQRAFSASG